MQRLFDCHKNQQSWSAQVGTWVIPKSRTDADVGHVGEGLHPVNLLALSPAHLHRQTCGALERQPRFNFFVTLSDSYNFKKNRIQFLQYQQLLRSNNMKAQDILPGLSPIPYNPDTSASQHPNAVAAAAGLTQSVGGALAAMKAGHAESEVLPQVKSALGQFFQAAGSRDEAHIAVDIAANGMEKVIKNAHLPPKAASAVKADVKSLRQNGHFMAGLTYATP
jgi:hypothetical protein